MKKKKILGVKIIILIVLALVAEFIIYHLYTEILEYHKISSEVVEQVVEKNSDDIIDVLTDKKLRDSEITLHYDDVSVEMSEPNKIKAFAYGYHIYYEFNGKNLNKLSVSRDLVTEHPEIILIFMIVFLFSCILLIFFWYKDIKAENEYAFKYAFQYENNLNEDKKDIT